MFINKRTCKLRYPTWWYGRYIQWMGSRWTDEVGRTFPESQVNINEMEIYYECWHGQRSFDKKRGNPLQFTLEDKQEMLNMLNSGCSHWEVARRFETSEPSIRKLMKSMGHPLVRKKYLEGKKNGNKASDTCSTTG